MRKIDPAHSSCFIVYTKLARRKMEIYCTFNFVVVGICGHNPRDQLYCAISIHACQKDISQDDQTFKFF